MRLSVRACVCVCVCYSHATDFPKGIHHLPLCLFLSLSLSPLMNRKKFVLSHQKRLKTKLQALTELLWNISGLHCFVFRTGVQAADGAQSAEHVPHRDSAELPDGDPDRPPAARQAHHVPPLQTGVQLNRPLLAVSGCSGVVSWQCATIWWLHSRQDVHATINTSRRQCNVKTGCMLPSNMHSNDDSSCAKRSVLACTRVAPGDRRSHLRKVCSEKQKRLRF